MILGLPMTFLRYGQMCVLVAVAILGEVAWQLQICNSCFYQVNELWPMGLLFFPFVFSVIEDRKWASTRQNQGNFMSTQRRLKSVWASAQSDQPSLGAQWVAKDPSSSCGQRRLWSDWVDMAFYWFCRALAHISLFIFYLGIRTDIPE